jgi:hypothetical protein
LRDNAKHSVYLCLVSRNLKIGSTILIDACIVNSSSG